MMGAWNKKMKVQHWLNVVDCNLLAMSSRLPWMKFEEILMEGRKADLQTALPQS